LTGLRTVVTLNKLFATMNIPPTMKTSVQAHGVIQLTSSHPEVRRAEAPLSHVPAREKALGFKLASDGFPPSPKNS
jgi:hypothetical protein